MIKPLNYFKDTITLPTANVTEQPLRQSLIGKNTETWDSKNLKKSIDANLADLLQNESGIFIKTYGGGSLATVSTRGSSAGHTAILWNGLPIQSPMLGLLDLSLLPLAFIDEAEIQLGGNSAAQGSGAVGGTILLINQSEKKSFAEVSSRVGSFGFLEQRLKGQMSFGKLKSVTRLFHRRAKNDFAWQRRKDSPSEKTTNSALNQSGLLQEFYWSPKPNQQLITRFWGQTSFKEIPPTSVQNISLANQRDEALRFSADWKKTEKRFVWQIRTGAFKESIHYKNKEIGIDAPSHFWNFIGDADAEYFLSQNQRLAVGLSENLTYAHIDNYGDRKEQNRTAFFIGFLQKLNTWSFQLNLRQTIADKKLIPVVPALSFQGTLSKVFSITGKLSRNYRLPTLNDLYWMPGGNENLLPESGWSQEIGLSIKTSTDPEESAKRFTGSYSLAGFNRLIKNWIYWSPEPATSLWSPQNLTQVHSRGIEQRATAQTTYKNLKTILKIGYDFILSTNEIPLQIPKIEKGEQLWYVPENQAFTKLDLQYKDIEFTYRHQFTGVVQTPNFSSLKSYQTGNLTISFARKFKHWSGRIFFSINNVWNTDYRIIEYRPMPGRYFQTGMNLKILKK